MNEHLSPRVVCVCTGNICRSPAMELYLGRAWEGDAVVTSAGTVGVVGWHPPTPMREALKARGIDSSHHVAHQLEAEHVRSADLVLVAGHHHLAWTLRHVRAPVPHAFLLTEAAALTLVTPRPEAAARVDRIRAAAGVLDSARVRRPQDHEDIPDPYGHGHETYERVMGQIASNLDAIIAWIG